MIKTKNITFLVAIAVKLIDNALCLDWFKKAFYGPAHVSMWKSLKRNVTVCAISKINAF